MPALSCSCCRVALPTGAPQASPKVAARQTGSLLAVHAAAPSASNCNDSPNASRRVALSLSLGAAAVTQLTAPAASSSEGSCLPPLADTLRPAGAAVPASVDEVFAWLRWTPPASSACGKTLARSFPGALPASAVLQRSADVMQSHGCGEPADVLHGQSICPDEINYNPNGVAARMTEHWGEVFPLGGLGGAPFVGKTGFAAFSHHVPDNGHIFILFGPHIAVSDAGVLGKCHRHGQAGESIACGAVLAAYESCKKGSCVDQDDFDYADIQQSWLKRRVHENFDEIEASPEPLLKLIQTAYAAVENSMLKIVNHEYGSGKLLLLGGIQINMPNPYEDHFQPIIFQMSSKESSKPVDLLSELYSSGTDSRLGISLYADQGALNSMLAHNKRLSMTEAPPWDGLPGADDAEK